MRPTFFGNQVVSSSVLPSQRQRTPVDVGGHEDCLRSIAAGVIDSFLTHPRANAELLSKLLSEHYQYFPKQRPAGRSGTTPAEHVHSWLKTVRLAEGVQTLAYTLRKLAVKELCSDPSKYRAAFMDGNQETNSPQTLAQPGTSLNAVAIAALAQRLQIPVEVNAVAPGKELPLKLRYQHSLPMQAKVVIQLQEGHNTPMLMHPERFSAVKSQPVAVATPLVNANEKYPALTEVQSLIRKEDERMVTTYKNTIHRLRAMLAANELTQKSLLGAYVKSLHPNDHIGGRVPPVGLEHGNQAFFNAITTVNASSDFSSNTGFDQQVTQELIHALARAVSVGQLSLESLYASVESESMRSEQEYASVKL